MLRDTESITLQESKRTSLLPECLSTVLEERRFFNGALSPQHPITVRKTIEPCDDLTVLSESFHAALQVGLPLVRSHFRELSQNLHATILLRQLFAVMKRMH